jgi:regulator of sirC expression with transglutaminase-like and TPR domain
MTTIDNIQEIKSLISLLDDPDEAVLQVVITEILRRGPVVSPWLQEALVHTENPVVRKRLESLIHQLHLLNIRTRLGKWVAMGQDNLLLGALLVARYQYPDLKEENIIRRLGHITQDIYLRIKDGMSPMEKISIVNNVLFDDYEFYGNKRDHQAPPCYYLNMVFDTGKGNHLSLGILYMLVARSLGIPVVGVDLPDFFFLAYREEESMLFYINPFSRGNTLTQNELLFFLKLAEVDMSGQRIEPADNLSIIRRLITGLIEAYRRVDKPEKADDLEGLLPVLNS